MELYYSADALCVNSKIECSVVAMYEANNQYTPIYSS